MPVRDRLCPQDRLWTIALRTCGPLRPVGGLISSKGIPVPVTEIANIDDSRLDDYRDIRDRDLRGRIAAILRYPAQRIVRGWWPPTGKLSKRPLVSVVPHAYPHYRQPPWITGRITFGKGVKVEG